MNKKLILIVSIVLVCVAFVVFLFASSSESTDEESSVNNESEISYSVSENQSSSAEESEISTVSEENEPSSSVDTSSESLAEESMQEIDYSLGSKFTFGEYEQDNNESNGKEPINWIVIANEGDRVLVLSEYAIDAKPFNENARYFCWEDSTIRSWLNGDFLNAFNDSEKSKIINSSVSNKMYVRGYVEDTDDTNDRIFLLSISEAEKYCSSSSISKCAATDYASGHFSYSSGETYCTWMLRSPGHNSETCGCVDLDGEAWGCGTGGGYVTNAFGIRPAMWLSTEDTPIDDDTSEEEKSEEKDSEVKQWTEYDIGDFITFGSFEQDNNSANGKEDIEWKILSIDGEYAFVVSKYILYSLPYNDDNRSVTWESSSIRSWLNDTFYGSAFNSFEKEIVYKTYNDNKPNQWGVSGGSETRDYVYLLSVDEVEIYLSSSEDKNCVSTQFAREVGCKTNGAKTPDNEQCSSWWLRSPGVISYNAACIGSDGINKGGDTVNSRGLGIRPAITINLKSYFTYFLNKEEKSEYNVGQTITFGSYEQDNDYSNGSEPIKWRILEIENGKALILSEYAIESRQYGNGNYDAVWENCELRSWLNDEFLYSAFTDSELARIHETVINNSYGENDTLDSLFLLSVDEIYQYFSTEYDRMCGVTTFANAQGCITSYYGDIDGYQICYWYLRTHGDSSCHSAFIDFNGNIDMNTNKMYQGYPVGIRPAMWITLD